MSEYAECPTPGCTGDARYAPPGRGHRISCTYLSPEPDVDPTIPRLRAASRAIREDPSPFGFVTVALTPDTLDEVLDRVEAAEAERDEAHASLDELSEDAYRTRDEWRALTARAEGSEAKVARAEALIPTFECEPPGQHPSQYLHRETCPGCSRADALRAALAGVCPTPCDDRCEADCHESHQPTQKRSHQPENCPARNPPTGDMP
jgi:hypothetical protein